MEQLIRKLQKEYPDLVFSAGEAHCWSPRRGEILYAASPAAADSASRDIAGLLHELGHARLGHRGFVSDFDLLQKEMQAWEEAVRLAETYGVEIDQNHVQNCLDTYRDWLFRRSRCPRCTTTGVQETAHRYHCANCQNNWEVSNSRLQRPYRRQAGIQKQAGA